MRNSPRVVGVSGTDAVALWIYSMPARHASSCSASSGWASSSRAAIRSDPGLEIGHAAVEDARQLAAESSDGANSPAAVSVAQGFSIAASGSVMDRRFLKSPGGVADDKTDPLYDPRAGIRTNVTHANSVGLIGPIRPK